MCQKEFLNYRLYRELKNEGGIFQFTGAIESITDGQTLWVKGDDLTLPVSLEKTKCFLLPLHEGDGFPEAPEQIRWKAVSTFTEGTKVFIGGQIKKQDNRLIFVSTKEEPLIVIFYNCSDTELLPFIIRSARTRSGYWNVITPAFLVIGALILISLAAYFLNRPAFRLTVISSIIAVFIPVLPVMPPGFIFTLLYRSFTWNARKQRVNCDLAHYGLIPETNPHDAKKFAVRAYLLEFLAWLFIILCILTNIAFIIMILSLFQVISF